MAYDMQPPPLPQKMMSASKVSDDNTSKDRDNHAQL